MQRGNALELERFEDALNLQFAVERRGFAR